MFTVGVVYILQDMQQHKTISSQQLFFLLNGTAIGIGVLYAPSSTIAIMKQNAWMAPLIGGVAMLLDIYLITALASRYPQLQLAEYSNIILGRFLGKLPTIIFIIYAILLVSIEHELIAMLFKTFLLPTTPPLVIRLMGTVMIIYAVSGGIDALARLNQVLIWFLAAVLILFIPAITLFSLTNLLPPGHIPLKAIWSGSQNMSFSLVGIELLLVWYPRISPQAQIRKVSFITYSSIIAVYFLIIVMVLLAVGPEFAPALTWAPLSLLKMIDLPTLGRLDFYAFLLWMAMGFRPMVNYLHAGATALKPWLKSVSFFWCTTILAIIAMGMTFIPHNITSLIKYSGYVGWLGLVVAFLIPALLLLVDIIRHGRKYCYIHSPR